MTKKYSLKDEATKRKMSSVVDRLISDEKVMSSVFPVADENMPEYQSDIPASGPTPEPLLKEEGSDGENVIINGEEVANPEYVYETEVPIYQKPERTGDGYAPLQREVDPQFDQGYAPGTKTRSEEKEEAMESNCGCQHGGEDFIMEEIVRLLNAEVSPEQIAEKNNQFISPVEEEGNVEVIHIQKEEDPTIEEVNMESDVIKQYYPATTPTWPNRRGE